VKPTTATLLTLVGERLDQMYGTWTLTDGGRMLRGPGRTAVMLGTDHGGGPGHLDLDFVFDVDRPAETTISDCVSGISNNPAEAVGQAVAVWSVTTVPALLELITGRGEFADHFRGTSTNGFPGWHMFAGGISGWGVGDTHGAMQKWMVDNLPWVSLAPVIATGLDRGELNGIKFFLAARKDYQVAEVRINGRVHAPSSQALLAQDWPRPAELTAARAFVLLVHPDDGH
jgi:uncharacterized protein DUF6348